MRLFLLLTAVLSASACSPSALLNADSTPAGVTGAQATGQYPDIQAVPPRAARQFDADDYSTIAAELNAEADRAAGRAPVNGAAADSRARNLVAQAEAEERERRRRIRNRGRVAPAGAGAGA